MLEVGLLRWIALCATILAIGICLNRTGLSALGGSVGIMLVHLYIQRLDIRRTHGDRNQNE